MWWPLALLAGRPVGLSVGGTGERTVVLGSNGPAWSSCVVAFRAEMFVLTEDSLQGGTDII